MACSYCVWVRAARAQTLAAATAGSVRFVRRRVPRRKRGRGQPPMCGVRCRRGLNGGEAEAVPRPGRSAPYHQGVPGRAPPSATRARTGRWVHPPVPRAGQPPACESIRRGKARARRAAPNTGVLPQDTCASQVARAVNQGSRPGGSMLPGELQKGSVRRPARLGSSEYKCQGSHHRWLHAAEVLTKSPARRPARPCGVQRNSQCSHPIGPRCSSVLVEGSSADVPRRRRHQNKSRYNHRSVPVAEECSRMLERVAPPRRCPRPAGSETE